MRLISLLFPPRCVLCRSLLEKGEQDLCSDCRRTVEFYPSRKRKRHFLDSYAAIWYYEGNVRESLLRFKFYGRRSYARAYGRILAEKLRQEYPEGFEVLTWAPVSRLRKLRRGYDQAELLARALGAELGMTPVSTLKKIRNNPPQSGMGAFDRRKANVLGLYRAVNPSEFAGKRMLLVDDILTTGATASECARVLLTAGAREVHCAAIAASRKIK